MPSSSARHPTGFLRCDVSHLTRDNAWLGHSSWISCLGGERRLLIPTSRHRHQKILSSRLKHDISRTVSPLLESVTEPSFLQQPPPIHPTLTFDFRLRAVGASCLVKTLSNPADCVIQSRIPDPSPAVPAVTLGLEDADLLCHPNSALLLSADPPLSAPLLPAFPRKWFETYSGDICAKGTLAWYLTKVVGRLHRQLGSSLNTLSEPIGLSSRRLTLMWSSQKTPRTSDVLCPRNENDMVSGLSRHALEPHERTKERCFARPETSIVPHCHLLRPSPPLVPPLAPPSPAAHHLPNPLPR